MADRVPLSRLYADTRERLTAFVGSHPDADPVPVPATPGWTVHDVVAHVTGVAEDIIGGHRPTGGPTDEWTAGHVARGRETSTVELLERWSRLSPELEQLLDATPIWPIVFDVGAHEHDIRGALGDTAARDTEIVVVGSRLLLKGLQVPRPLLVRTEHGETRVGPEADDRGPVTLTTTVFESFRWRLGRRSRRQLAAMDWSADPADLLDHLCVFGPAASDVIE